ncbi:MAG: alpha/beta hydrolase [Congregibacter sp.]|nr:alpha/beta hydrolase [Congregibacter sp.]
MTEWQAGDVDVAGINIHYHRTGNGELSPLVLCHGFSDNGGCWLRTARVLEPYYEVVMVDARNHGLSDRGPANLATMAEDVAGLISALDLDSPVLMGHSMGASMVAEVAAKQPGLVSRLILEDPPWTKHQTPAPEASLEKRREGFRQYLQSLQQMPDDELLQFARKTNSTWHEEDLPDWVLSKQQVSDSAMDGLELGRWSETVTAIQCPALLIYADGEGDGIVTHDIAKAVVQANDKFEMQHIEGAGHNTRREQFDAYIDAVKSFLKI